MGWAMGKCAYAAVVDVDKFLPLKKGTKELDRVDKHQELQPLKHL